MPKESNKRVNKVLLIFSILAFSIAIAIAILDVILKIDFTADFKDVNTIFLTVLSVVFTLWFSYLLVMKQIYANGFTKGFIDKENNASFITVVIDFIFLFIFGVIVNIFASKLFLCHIAFCVLSFGFVAFCAANIYFKIKNNEVDIIIENSLKNIINKFKGDGDQEELKAEINKLENIYDEFLYKGNSNMCLQIIQVYCKVIESYIANYSLKIVEGKDNEEYAILYCINYLQKLFRFDGSDITNKLNEVILNNVYKLAKVSLKCRNIKVEEALVKLVEKIAKDFNAAPEKFYNLVFKNNAFLICESIDRKDKESFDLILNSVKSIYISTEIQKEVALCALLCKFLISCVVYCLGNNEEIYIEYYKALFDEFEQFVVHDEKFRNHEMIEYMLTVYIRDEKFSKCTQAKEDYFKFMENIIKSKEIYTNRDFIGFLVSSIFYFKEEKFIDDNKLMEMQYKLARRAFDVMEKPPTYVIPTYLESIKNNLDNLELNRLYANNISRLLQQSIVKNMYSHVITINRDIKDILANFKQQHKECEKVWLNVFFRSLKQASLINDSQMQNLVLDDLENNIIEMDKKHNISKDLAIYIVKELEKLCTGRFRDEVNFICSIIELLDLLVDKDLALQFVTANNDVREAIFNSIFSVGVDAIEKAQVLVIQRVSNIIGWNIYHAIDDGKTYLANRLIDYALDIYRLCYVNEIDNKTIVFVGTLFVIIGAFCSTKPVYFGYRSRIITGLKKKNPYEEERNYFKYIMASKQLREHGLEDWDILGKDPKKAVNDFFKEYQK